MVTEGHPVGEVVCTQRTLSEAYREDQGTLAIRGALWQFTSHLRPDQLIWIDPEDGQHRRVKSGDVFRIPSLPGVRVEVGQADSLLVRAQGTHPDTPAQCVVRVTNTWIRILLC
jgi:hypothetical protein